MFSERRAVRAGRRSGRLALAASLIVLGVTAPGAAAGTPAFFGMSAIGATPVPGASATRFAVTVEHAPTDNSPAFRWALRFAGHTEATGCENRGLAGARSSGPGELVWANQGASFVWYRAATTRCNATLSVTAENEYEHCVASLPVSGAAETASGTPAACALGGFALNEATLPVPKTVLSTYSQLGSELARLVGELHRGTVNASGLSRLLAPILARERSAFGNLFPPVFGCGFAQLFDPLVSAQTALDEQLAGTSVSAAADLRAAARAISTCARSSTNAGGAPPEAVSALAGLAREAKGHLGHAGLTTLARSLDSALGHGFPAVFGIPYRELVDGVAGASSAIARAEAAGGGKGAAAALAAAAAPAKTISSALVRHQKHVIKIENANG